jgi:meso-butanediol dehydrogenase / (S,S)-butanediol dehydrogenase / diacetyl reductase
MRPGCRPLVSIHDAALARPIKRNAIIPHGQEQSTLSPFPMASTVASALSPIKGSLNKIAFVTGAAQGIGRAIALRLARDGYDVAVHDIPQSKEKVDAVVSEIASYGRQSLGVFADVRDAKQLYAAIDETVDKLGPRLFVSVANAGVTQVRPLLECTPEFIENEIRINVLGMMNTHIAAAKQMVKQGGGGRILAAGSIASYRTANNLAPYGATKFAVRGFTEAAAKEVCLLLIFVRISFQLIN